MSFPHLWFPTLAPQIPVSLPIPPKPSTLAGLTLASPSAPGARSRIPPSDWLGALSRTARAASPLVATGFSPLRPVSLTDPSRPPTATRLRRPSSRPSGRGPLLPLATWSLGADRGPESRADTNWGGSRSSVHLPPRRPPSR